VAATLADRDTLLAAIAAKARGEQIARTTFADRSVDYSQVSLDEMYAELARIERELAATSDPPRPRMWYGSGSKGTV
jgi:hypothetical protein